MPMQMPGGRVKHFWDDVKMRSAPILSGSIRSPPADETVSMTTIMLGNSFLTALVISSAGLRTPVEVSFCTKVRVS